MRWILRGLIALVVLGATGGGLYWLYEVRKADNADNLLAVARGHAAQADWPQAVQAFRNWAHEARDNDDPVVLREYADAVLEIVNAPATPMEQRRKHVDVAIELLSRLTRMSPNDEKSQSELTLMYTLQGNHQAALRHVENRWMPAAPKSVEPLIARIDSLVATEQFDLALQQANEALEVHPKDPKLHSRLIGLRTGPLADEPGADKALDEAIKACPESWRVNLAASRYYFNKKDIKLGQHHLDKALELAPEEPAVLAVSAQVAVQTQDLVRAREYLDRARDAGAGDTLAVLLSEAQWARAQTDAGEKIRVADALMEASHDSVASMIAEAAGLYLDAGQLDPLRSCISKLEKLENTEAAVPELKGKLALADGDPAGAIAPLREAVERQPNRVTPAFLLGRALRRLGRDAEARQVFQRALSIRPTAIEPRLQLADLALRAGDLDEAKTHLDVARNVDPVNQLGSQLSLQYELQSLIEVRRLVPETPLDRKALEDLQARMASAVEGAPEDVALIQLLATAYTTGEQHDQAIALIQDKMSIPSIREPMAITLANLYARNDRAKEAEELLRATQKNADTTNAGAALIALLVGQARFEDAGAVADSPNDPSDKARLWQTLAHGATQAGNLEAAQHAIERIVELSPDDIENRQRLLRLDAVAQNASHAQKIIDQLQAIDGPDGLVWRVERARWLLRNENASDTRKQEAIQLLEHCRDARPTWTEPLILLAFAYESRLGDKAAALEMYEAAAEIDSELVYSDVGKRLAVLLKEAERFDAADIIVSRIRQRQPDSVFALEQLLEQRTREKNFDAAIVIAERLSAHKNDNPLIKVFTSELNLRTGKTEQAEQDAREAMRNAPDDARPVGALMLVLLATNRDADAEHEVRAFVNAHETNPDGYVLLGQLLAKAQRFDQATTAFEKAAEHSHDNPTVLRQVSTYFGFRGDFDKQVDFLEKAIVASGRQPDHSTELAKLLLAAGIHPAHRQEGKAIVDRVLSATPDNPEAKMLSTLNMATNTSEGRNQAIATLTEVLEADPNLREPYGMLAGLHVSGGESREAVDIINRGLARFPNDIRLRMQSAAMALQERRWSDARMDTERVLEISPGHLDALGGRARALEGAAGEMSASDPRRTPLLVEAEKAVNDRCAAAPDTTPYAIDRVHFYARQNNADRILELAEAAAGDNNHDHAVLLEAASVALNLSDDPEAKKWCLDRLNALVNKNFQVARIKRYLGLYFQRTGEIDQAESNLNQALTADPDDGAAVNALAWLYCEDRQRYDAAEDLILGYWQNNPRTIEALDTYGVIQFRQGKFKESIRTFEDCLRNVPPGSQVEVAVRFHLGRSLHKDEQIENALEMIRSAKESPFFAKVLTDAERAEAEQLLR
jgi:tetratricopeptide (TPR) repeat protein